MFNFVYIYYIHIILLEIANQRPGMQIRQCYECSEGLLADAYASYHNTVGI